MSTSPGPTRKLVHALPARTVRDRAVVSAAAFDVILERQRIRAQARDEHLAVLVFEQRSARPATREAQEPRAGGLEPLGRVLSELSGGGQVGWLADGRLGMLLDTPPTDVVEWRRRLQEVNAALPASDAGDALVRTSVRVITDEGACTSKPEAPARPEVRGQPSWSMPLCW